MATVFACLVVQVFPDSVLIARFEYFVVWVGAGEGVVEQVHVELRHVHRDFCLD